MNYTRLRFKASGGVIALVFLIVISCNKSPDSTPTQLPYDRDSLAATILHMPKNYRGTYIHTFVINSIKHSDTLLNYSITFNLNADTIFHRFNRGTGTFINDNDTLFSFSMLETASLPYVESFSWYKKLDSVAWEDTYGYYFYGVKR